MKLPIPTDWTEEDGYTCLLACIPNSPEWKAVYIGAFYQLTYWTAWDKDTGNLNQVKSITNQIYKELCMANCDDIVLALNRIADALGGDGINPGLVDLVGISTQLDDIKAAIDQLEEIQNNQTLIFGGEGVTVLPGGGA